MRLFLAIEPTEEIRNNLLSLQERLRETGADVKWSEPENVHLTVVFLGDLSDALLPDIEAACEVAAKGIAPFRIRVRGASYFPRRGPQIKTLWTGLAEGVNEWKALAQYSEEQLKPFGIAPSNDLVPHFTLGRVKSDRAMDALRAAVATDAATEFGTQDVNELMLVQSFLDPRGATYKTLQTWKLPTNG